MDAVLLAVGRDPVGVARIEQRLRRDAAHRHACSAHAVTLDERDARSLRARVQRRDIATGTAAEDRDVVLGH